MYAPQGLPAVFSRAAAGFWANLVILLFQYISAVSGAGSCHQYDCLHMSWDNSVNKNGIIYAVATTLGVRNMPLTS